MSYENIPVTEQEDEEFSRKEPLTQAEVDVLFERSEADRLREEATALKDAYITARKRLVDAEKIATPLEETLKERLAFVTKEHRTTHNDAYQEYGEALSEAFETENALRAKLVEFYKATKEKTIDSNLSVRVTKSYEYAEDLAVRWAEDNAKMLVEKSVNKKGFIALIETQTAKPDFVRTTEKPSAVISGLN